jgi:chromate transporter
MSGGNAVVQIALRFSLLSLLSFGGVNVVLPDAHRFVVENQHWLTDQQFADYFAIAQAAPGPNFLMFALIGWQVAGLAGATVAALAIGVPAGTLAFIAGGLWHLSATRRGGARSRQALPRSRSASCSPRPSS